MLAPLIIYQEKNLKVLQTEFHLVLQILAPVIVNMSLTQQMMLRNRPHYVNPCIPKCRGVITHEHIWSKAANYLLNFSKENFHIYQQLFPEQKKGLEEI
ncbi:Uncharacterized protein FWK35_00028464 [Aphis craccivora]|uniref:Uncharacterized protein n=1 Tax=Aphis craccivora TaxID=307492 RepID=A0A6G0VIU0_APHCR|nr:Uncharacterized protein FWK35_00028464 [Aphis craccivora]